MTSEMTSSLAPRSPPAAAPSVLRSASLRAVLRHHRRRRRYTRYGFNIVEERARSGLSYAAAGHPCERIALSQSSRRLSFLTGSVTCRSSFALSFASVPGLDVRSVPFAESTPSTVISFRAFRNRAGLSVFFLNEGDLYLRVLIVAFGVSPE